MASNRTLNYLIDTSGATRVDEFSWPCSVYSESALCPNHMVHQGENCVCYGFTVSEATRAVINLKTGANIPKLSAIEVIKNCHDINSKGYTAPMAFEWIVKEGIVEDSVMPIDLNAELVKGKAENGHRYQIDEWETVPNCDAAIKSYLIRQPVVVSLNCPPSLFSCYNGGLVDPYLMQKAKNANNHSMLLVGFGFYAFPDRSIKYYWQLKTSMGDDSEERDYI
ncbi:cysteine endopeptidase RepA-like [Silene latifolia]|uniref:cysteine endopeptidase RepA-like n=1 Tax=Silene latifolia TaxID=37657 RepID=UPI003D7701F2